ncbi:Dipeptidyl-peptidase 5 [Alternaria alternata]|nr:Dipeptidyl-peptidase 5 [Alternaria alternata]
MLVFVCVAGLRSGSFDVNTRPYFDMSKWSFPPKGSIGDSSFVPFSAFVRGCPSSKT